LNDGVVGVVDRFSQKGCAPVLHAADVDRVTQDNAASAEESSTASIELASEARTLSKMVARFQIDDETESRTPRRRSESRPVITAVKGSGRCGQTLVSSGRPSRLGGDFGSP
jgi:hypothetical protein